MRHENHREGLIVMSNGQLIGGAIGTAVMPGIGTAVGSAIGGWLSGGPSAQQHQSDIGGRSIDAYQIFQQIKGGPGTGSLEAAGTAAQELQNNHEDRAQKIAALNQMMDSAWQGDGSQAAQAGAHPLRTWLNDSAQNLGTSHQFIGNQINDFHTVSSRVQEIPQNPPSKGWTDDINPWSDKDDEINSYNRKGQANVDAFNAYYQASAQNAAGMPQFQT
ncbi:PPE domain-containing protein, partial [Amycolatopsis rhizosphaerae]